MEQGLRLSVVGVGAGLIISAALARVMSSIVYGVTARDPVTYAAASVAVLAIAMSACYGPARRAAAADPVVLLKSE
jgi:putative ABC transport system permease protein